jgi:hypothetical protein
MLVDLTPQEARALRLASIFGGPDVKDPTLEGARRKLREAESPPAPMTFELWGHRVRVTMEHPSGPIDLVPAMNLDYDRLALELDVNKALDLLNEADKRYVREEGSA